MSPGAEKGLPKLIGHQRATLYYGRAADLKAEPAAHTRAALRQKPVGLQANVLRERSEHTPATPLLLGFIPHRDQMSLVIQSGESFLGRSQDWQIAGPP